MKRRARPILAVLAITAAALVLGLRPSADEPYRVELVFEDAAGLREGGDVKVRGLRAGRIESVELDRHDRARVAIRLFEGVGPVGADARAESRPTGPLGETYIHLEPGDTRPLLPSGSVIGADRTRRYVGIDQVLDTLDAPTRARLRILVNEAGVGLAGRGSDLNRLLAALPGSLAETERLLGQVRTRNRRLRRLIAGGDRVLAAVAPHRDELGTLVADASRTLEATASRRAALGAAVEDAPGAVRRLRATLDLLAATAGDLRPTARQLEAAAGPLARTLAAVPPFERDARPLLRTVAAAAPTVERFARRTAPVVRELAPVAGELASTARALRPVFEVLDDGGTTQFLRWADGMGQTAELRDSLGHFARNRMVIDEDALESAIDQYLGLGAAQAGRAPAEPLLDFLLGR